MKDKTGFLNVLAAMCIAVLGVTCSVWAAREVIYENNFLNAASVEGWNLNDASWNSTDNGILSISGNATSPVIIPEGRTDMVIQFTGRRMGNLIFHTSSEISGNNNFTDRGVLGTSTGSEIQNITVPLPDGTRRIRFTVSPPAFGSIISMVITHTDYTAVFDNGDGTENNPFLIQNIGHLERFRNLVNEGDDFSGKFVKLTSNIALNNTDGWENWSATVAPANSWTPIGMASVRSFGGTFDGGGFEISGVYINSTALNTVQGFFGNIGVSGTIRNLGVVNSFIRNNAANAIAGGLTANNNGRIINCYFIGTIAGSGTHFGGLVARNGGHITNCYTAATITATGSAGAVGGLAGDHTTSHGGRITASYYDLTGGLVNNTNGIQVTTAFMQSAEFVGLMNMSAEVNAWVRSVGNYPRLNRGVLTAYTPADYFGTAGTESDPFMIGTVAELEFIRLMVADGIGLEGQHVKLSGNIALNNTDNWEYWGDDFDPVVPANTWTPIGSDSNPFRGTFDGGGYTISGIYMNATNRNGGLFNVIAQGATIKNLGVTKSFIRGNTANAIVIQNNGTVTNCYSTATVRNSSGNNPVGGLAGGGTITNSYSIGGLTGNFGGTVINSYTSADLSQPLVDYLNISLGETPRNLWVLSSGGYPVLITQMNNRTIPDHFDGGNGTAGSPFQINNALQLHAFRILITLGEEFEGQFVELTDNIALNDTSNWEEWETTSPANRWIPLKGRNIIEGHNARVTSFKGTLDGAGFEISGVYIRGGSELGFFETIHRDATVKNLGIVNSFIRGFSNIGGLASGNFGTVVNCWFIGDVQGWASLGGLVAYNGNGMSPVGTISNSYTIANVTRIDTTGFNSGNIAGFASSNHGHIRNCYAAGTVRILGTATAFSFAGFAGSNASSLYNATLVNCYFDNETYGRDNSSPVGAGVQAVSTAYMQSEGFVSVLNAMSAFGLASPGNVWEYSAGNYPVITSVVASNNVADYFDSGSGTESDPYLIKTASQLLAFGGISNFGAKNFAGEHIKLAANITLQAVENNWRPISSFAGTLDGNGFEISGVNVVHPVGSTNFAMGFFGTLADGAVVRNLGVVNSTISGFDWTGGLVGSAVSGSSIVNSYFTGSVSGRNSVGGLVGSNSSSINNCWASAVVTGTSRGALVGSGGMTVINSFYDSDVSTVGGTGTPRTTAYMQSGIFVDLLNLTAGGISANAWEHRAGQYPRITQNISDITYADLFDGEGTESEPFLIGTADRLELLGIIINSGVNFQGQHIKLTNDIQLPAGEWTSLGTQERPFAGTFDGGDFVVRGVNINRPDVNVAANNNHGFFGFISSTATIKNLGIVESTIRGASGIGALVGQNDGGTIINCFADATVEARNMNAGGLIGTNWGGVISHSRTSGSVSGNSTLGGLIGQSGSGGSISYSYSTASVTVTTGHGGAAGGLVGRLGSGLVNSYSIGAVTVLSGGNAGGLIGSRDFGGNVQNSFYDSQTSGRSDNTDNGTPKTTAEMKQMATFTGWDFDGGAWAIREGVTYPYLCRVILPAINLEYDGEAKEFLSITHISGSGREAPLAKGTHYNITYSPDNINAGEVTATIEGTGAWAFINMTRRFTITPLYVDVDWSANETFEFIYDGSEKEITAVSTNSGYPIELSNNKRTNWGNQTATATLVGNHGNNVLLRNAEKDFTINRRIVPVIWQGDVFTFTYDGIARTITAVSSDENYPIQLSNNTQTNAGNHLAVAELVEPNDNITLQNSFRSFSITRARGEGGVMIEGWRLGSNTNDPVPFSETNGIVGVTYTYESADGVSYPRNPAKPSNPGAYIIRATFPQTQNYFGFVAENNFVIMNTDAIPLEVVWTEQTEFVYNRMVQVPIPSVKGRPDIALIVLNGFSAVGEYKGPLSALAIIVNESDRRLYDLQNNTREYTIIQRPLDIVMRNRNGQRTDTLEVPGNIDIENEEELLDYVKSIIDYDGFAVDKEGDADDASVLRGELTFEIRRGTRARSLEPGEYVITISGANVSARNYSLSKRELSVTVTAGGRITFSTEYKDPTSIRKDDKAKDKTSGIRFARNIVSDKAEISVNLPNGERAVETKIVIYDMTGNVVWASTASTGSATGAVWDLRNTAGRFVANGTYLVIAEAKDRNGRMYQYSARLGVKR